MMGKNKFIFFTCFAGIFLLLISCENREWDNPFDPDCPKELFTPTGFTAKQEDTMVKLNWSQSNTQITGFVIERSIDGGATWSSVATPAKTELTWSDSNITGGKEHKYRLVAKAGTNRSNKVTTQITPVFASTLTTSPLTKLLSTTAVLGGNITADGGSAVTARGVCWSNSPNPTISNNKTSDGTGTGSFTSTITGLSIVTTYYVRAYSTNSTGTSYGNEITFKTFFGEVTDVEGNIYPTVKIGTQVWMAENLKTTRYNDGTAIPNVSDNTQWKGLTTGALCWFNNDITLKNIYGAMYNWYAINTGKLAPVGWHVATDAEWTTLANYLGGESVTGGKLKEIGTSHWQSPNTGATNETAFTAIAGGLRNNDGTFVGKNIYGYWWTYTAHVDPGAAWNRFTQYNNSILSRTPGEKTYGFYIRCVLGTLNSPTISTTAISNKTTTSATSGGNITSDGGSAITARGVCWSTSPNPTTANSKTTDGTGTGSFTSNIIGLTANTTYYVRAYATNSQGTAYGAQESFTTSQSASLAIVTTNAASNVTSSGATVSGNVTNDGGSNVTERGFCWTWEPWGNLPTKQDSFKIVGSGTGSFVTELSYLESNTNYYVRAYAINSQGISYGNVVSFKTSKILSVPTVITYTPRDITHNSATLGGQIMEDGDTTITERGIVYSLTQNPTTSNSKVIVGGVAEYYSTTVSGLTANTTYYVRAYAKNSQGTGYGEQVSFTTKTSTAQTVTDIEGNVYNIVTIGTQVWMAENLKTTKYNDGTAIPNITGNIEWQNLSTGAYCWHNNDANNLKLPYGALYNWFTVNTGKICPKGWHVPSDTDWTIMTNYLGGDNIAGGKLKETGTIHWINPNLGATNETGFTAVPGGYRIWDNGGAEGAFWNFGSYGYWWASTEFSTIEAKYRALGNGVISIGGYGYGFEKWCGLSVRCIKD